MSSLIKDLSMKAVAPKPGDAPVVETKPPRMSMIKEFSSVQTALKTSDATDAGKNDVADRASAASDIGFNLMRNTINSSGEVTGSDVANYIERAEELNDEVDTVPFGLETDDGKIVKVYVNAEQADKFEEAMKNMLGLEDDIEEAINRLTTEFDIVDVVWPKNDDEDGDGEPDPDADLDIDDTSNLDDEDDFADDQYDVIAGGDTTDETPPEADASTGKVKASKDDDEEEEESKEDPEEEADETDDEEAAEEDDEDESDDDNPDDDPDKPKKKKKKKKKSEDKAEPAEPATAAESKTPRGRPLSEKKDPRDEEADSSSTAAAVKVMTSKGLHIAAMKEAPGNVVYIEDSQGDEYVLRGDKKLTKEKHGKKLMSLKKEDTTTQENQMTIGNKFLERVLNEADGQDTDGVKDGFNIPLDSQARAMAAKQKLPFAKRLIAFHFMCGVPGRYMNTADVSEAIAGAADMLRKKVAVRRQFTILYEGLAAAKGFNIPKDDQAPVKESKIDEAKAKRGSFIQKLLESVLVQLGLPDNLITTTGPSAVGTGIYRTAELIEQDSTLERALRQLATRMGIRGSDAQAAVEEGMNEAKKPKLPKDKDVPIEVTGVKGMKSTPWSKKFKNQAAMETWMDKHGEDITVQAYSTDRVMESDARYSKLSQMAEGRAARDTVPMAKKKEDIGWFIISKVGSKAVDGPYKTKAKADEEIKYRADHDQSKPGETAQYGKAESMHFTKMDPVNEAVDVGNDPYAQAVASLVAALGIPDDILQRRRTQIVQALRVRKQTLNGRPQIMTLMARLSDLIAKNTTQNGQAAADDDEVNEAQDSDDMIARKVYAKVKGEPNLTTRLIKQMTKDHAAVQGKSASEISNIASLVIDMADEKGLL